MFIARALHIVACQFDLVWEDREANYAAVRRYLNAEAPPPGSLVVLPEMFASGFSMDVTRVAEPPAAPTRAFLRELAQTCQSWVLGGLVEHGPGTFGRNLACLVRPDGSEAGTYQKIRTFTYAGEGDHYERGRDLLLAPVGDFTLCPFICYDLRFPELFRRGVARDASLFAVIANWPSVRLAHWLALLRARAIENQAIVVGVNRTGSDPQHAYPGHSIILDEKGNTLAEAGDSPGCIRAEVSFSQVQTWRRDFPALQDRLEH